MLNMDSSYVREMMNLSHDMVSLDADIGNGDSTTTMGDYIEAPESTRPDTIVMKEAMKNEIDVVLDELKPSEAEVIRMRYGLNGYEPMSLQEAGDKCKLSKERVRQIERKAILRMQHPKRSRRLEVFIEA